MFHNLPTYSNLVILAYLTAMGAIGVLVSRWNRENSTTEYFLAGSNVGWFALGTSLFVTTLSAGWFLSLADVLPSRSDQVLWGGMLGALFVLVLGVFFAPRFLRSTVFTVPQLLSGRLDRTTWLSLSGLSIFLNVAVRIPLVIFWGSWVLGHALGWDMTTSALLIVVVTGLYTIAGGLSAVIYAQVIQAGIVVLGSLLLMLSSLGGPRSGSLLSGEGGSLFFLSSPAASGSTAPWPGLLLGILAVGTWYWFSDQYVVHRVLAAKNKKHALRGTILAAWLILLQIAVLGLIPLSTTESQSQSVFGTALDAVTKRIIPIAFLSLLMSSLSAFFHSTATLFTMDFYRSTHPGVDDSTLVLVGRLAITGIVVFAILIVSSIAIVGSDTTVHLRCVLTSLTPPIAAVFLLSLTWRRVVGKCALWALIAGELFGLTHLVAGAVLEKGDDTLPFVGAIAGAHDLFIAASAFAISAFVLVTLSFLREAPAMAKEPTPGERGSGTVDVLRSGFGARKV